MTYPSPREAQQQPRQGHDGRAGARPAVDLGRLLMLGSLLVISFRLAAVPLIVWLCLRRPRRPFRLAHLVGPCLLALALLSPVDVGVPGLGAVMGHKRPGVRLVRVVAGMPAHSSLVARYGEYVSLGCAGLPCLYPPLYWIVWW